MNVNPRSNEMLFVPLGGTGEIGMNMTLYGHDGQWLIVDIGITFGNDAFPGHDVLMADPAFAASQRDHLAGIVLTHGHEDHIGALPYLWPRLRCPVYATPFTAALVRAKLARAGIDGVPLIEVASDERWAVGPFTVGYIGMTHSIPEPNMLLIETAAGRVLHTGDWKLDDEPVIDARYDRARLRALRREPLLAMVCDSTNAVVPGRTPGEGSLLAPLTALARQAEGRLVVTAFASNVARLVTLARVADRVGRRFGVVGQAMERMVAVARATGYWPDELPALVAAQHLGYLPRTEVMAACTGSQGEPRSALARIADGTHRDVLLEPGDCVIFSSRLIPGNERPVRAVERRLEALGVRVVDDRVAHTHVSGHPAETDLRTLYGWVQPTTVVPVHGTPRHLRRNAAIAADCHVHDTPVVANGDLCRLTPGGLVRLGTVANGRLTVRRDGGLEPVPDAELAAMRAAEDLAGASARPA